MGESRLERCQACSRVVFCATGPQHRMVGIVFWSSLSRRGPNRNLPFAWSHHRDCDSVLSFFSSRFLAHAAVCGLGHICRLPQPSYMATEPGSTMRILLTGATGYVGGQLVPKLVEA